MDCAYFFTSASSRLCLLAKELISSFPTSRNRMSLPSEVSISLLSSFIARKPEYSASSSCCSWFSSCCSEKTASLSTESFPASTRISSSSIFLSSISASLVSMSFILSALADSMEGASCTGFTLLYSENGFVFFTEESIHL